MADKKRVTETTGNRTLDNSHFFVRLYKSHKITGFFGFFSAHGRKTLWFKISAIIQDIEICVTRQR